MWKMVIETILTIYPMCPTDIKYPKILWIRTTGSNYATRLTLFNISSSITWKNNTLIFPSFSLKIKIWESERVLSK